GIAAAVDPKTGDVIITGRFDHVIDTDDPMPKCAPLDAMLKEDAFLAKLDHDLGLCSWMVRTNSDGNAHADGVAIDAAGNIYMSGAFLGTLHLGGPMIDISSIPMQGDTFFIKYTPDGVPMFGRGLAPSGEATVTIDQKNLNLLFSGNATGKLYDFSNQ